MCTVCNWSAEKPQPVQIFIHNFSYARIARQLLNKSSSSCTQDRLEIIVDVHRLIWEYTVTVIQLTVNHGSHESMRSFLAQGVTNKTKLMKVKNNSSVLWCKHVWTWTGHCQGWHPDLGGTSKEWPCPCNLTRTHRAVPQPPRGTKHNISVFDVLSLRLLLDIQSLTASTQSQNVRTIPGESGGSTWLWSYADHQHRRELRFRTCPQVDYFCSRNDEKKWTQYGTLRNATR